MIRSLGDRQPTDSRALARAIAEVMPGDIIPVTIWRQGKELTLTVKVAEAHKHPLRDNGMGNNVPAPKRVDTKDFGLHLDAVTNEVCRKLKLEPGDRGGLVTKVALNSAAADVGMRAGDVILRVRQDRVDGPADARRHLDVARYEKGRYILILIKRDDGFHWRRSPASTGSYLPLSGRSGSVNACASRLLDTDRTVLCSRQTSLSETQLRLSR